LFGVLEQGAKRAQRFQDAEAQHRPPDRIAQFDQLTGIDWLAALDCDIEVLVRDHQRGQRSEQVIVLAAGLGDSGAVYERPPPERPGAPIDQSVHDLLVAMSGVPTRKLGQGGGVVYGHFSDPWVYPARIAQTLPQRYP
jgi:hypothetical protein